MLAASVFSLLVPALEVGSLQQVLVGFALGALVVALLDVAIPHVHARFVERRPVAEGSRALLLLSALTIHNIPEGLAVGVAFAAGGTDLGLPVAIAIGVQNVPEGFRSGRAAARCGGVPVDRARRRGGDGPGGAARCAVRIRRGGGVRRRSSRLRSRSPPGR